MRAPVAVLLVAIAASLGAPAASAAAVPVSPAGIPSAPFIADDVIEQQLSAWVPTDGDWSVTDSSDTTGHRGDCAEGRVIHWSDTGGDSGGLVWAKCDSHQQAVDLLNATYADQGFFPAAGIEPAFGNGLDLASPNVGFTLLNRLWTQGDWFVTFSRTCPLASCGELTAGYARELAAIIGQPVDALTPITRQADDYFSTWAPADSDRGWRLYQASRLGDSDLARCEDGAVNSWTATDGAYVSVFWVRCASTAIAFQFQHERWLSLSDSGGLATVFGPDLVSRYYPPNGLEGITRSWVQGDTYVNVERTCPAGEPTCLMLTAQYARELSPLLPGTIELNTTLDSAVGEAGWLFFAVPIATFLLLLVPQRVYFWWRSRGYSVAGSAADFTDVGRLVRRVRLLRILRRVIVAVLTTVAWWFSVFAVIATASNVVLQLAYVLLSPFLFAAVFSLVLGLLWRPHPLIGVARRRGRPTGLGLVGTVIRWVAAAFAVASVATYFFASLLLITDRELTRATIRQSIDFAFTPPYEPSFLAFSIVRAVVHFLDDSGTYFLVFLLLLVVPVTLAYLLDRFGQRLTRRSLDATLATDDRPYFLYLRGFDEDRLRVDESVGRRGFLELFTPFGRPRFEEVLVEYLSLYGPVIAISGGRQVLSDLGAAKMSLGNDQWRGKVQEWSAGARAVVMSATPREVRAGLEWEIEHVASVAAGIRIMLVVSPWKRAEVARRWAGFLERAGATALFAPLREKPMPSGVEVMTYSAGNGWRGYGARRRWDWTYAASIITAMKRGDLDT